MIDVFSESSRIRELITPNYEGPLPITVYHEKAVKENVRIMLVFMNPSLKKGETIDDPNRDDESVLEAREGFTNWLREKSSFFGRFISTLSKHVSGEYCFKEKNLDLIEYFDSGFFNDFYVTDAVKLRLTTPELRKILALEGKETRMQVNNEWRDLLLKEIEIVSPSIIFSFGGNAWGYMRDACAPSSKLSVTNVHGDCFKFGESDYIPLAFVPGTSSYLKSSYFDYLRLGLQNIFPSVYCPECDDDYPINDCGVKPIFEDFDGPNSGSWTSDVLRICPEGHVIRKKDFRLYTKDEFGYFLVKKHKLMLRI